MNCTKKHLKTGKSPCNSKCVCTFALNFVIIFTDFGDEYGRVKNGAKVKPSNVSPKCLVRAFASAKRSKFRISTTVSADNCDLFRKRIGSVMKKVFLQTKTKRRSSSQ